MKERCTRDRLSLGILVAASAMALLGCNGRTSDNGSAHQAGAQSGANATGAGAAGSAAGSQSGGSPAATGGAGLGPDATGASTGAAPASGGAPIVDAASLPVQGARAECLGVSKDAPYSDGCNTCTCEHGDWVCTRNVCAGMPACPAKPPAWNEQVAGGVPGQICANWGDCSPVCISTSGIYQCQWPSCACPPTVPDVSLGCTQPELYCRYGSTCYRCGVVGRDGITWITGPCSELR